MQVRDLLNKLATYPLDATVTVFVDEPNGSGRRAAAPQKGEIAMGLGRGPGRKSSDELKENDPQLEEGYEEAKQKVFYAMRNPMGRTIGDSALVTTYAVTIVASRTDRNQQAATSTTRCTT